MAWRKMGGIPVSLTSNLQYSISNIQLGKDGEPRGGAPLGTPVALLLLRKQLHPARRASGPDLSGESSRLEQIQIYCGRL